MLNTGRIKNFANRLNKCLDDLGVPGDTRNRSAVLSKMLCMSRQQTRMLLEGYLPPNESVLNQLAKEFEVEVTWLLTEK